MVHSVFSSEMISLPRECPTIYDYANEMTRMAKVTTNHPDTGIPKTVWRGKLGGKPDDYFHATAYFLLAANKTSPRKMNQKKKPLVIRNNHYL